MCSYLSSWLFRDQTKFVTLCLAFLSLLLAPTSHAQKILVLGDSLSAAYNIPVESGWVNLLAEDLAPKYEVINASVSGETTSGGLARLPSLLETHSPNWVIIALGGNDGLRGFPLQLLRSNLAKLGGLVEDAGAKPIYFGIRIPPNYGARYTRAFEQSFPYAAEEKSAPYLNLFQEQFYTDESLLQRDGIHPTEKAQPLIKGLVLEFLQNTLVQGQ
ncbi:UNVERIFIED_CONTAM: hypothetical protein GTU68_014248 [Idotea baltica]|nr:hypothetical protein [Idotea baltica]